MNANMIVSNFSMSIAKMAFKVSIVVGTILVMINHGDLMLSGSYPPYEKIFLTYLVPFCVSTYGAISQNDSTLRVASVESKEVSVASKGDMQ